VRRFTVVDATEVLTCCVKACGKPARHIWGDAKVPFCCQHFTDLVIDIFDLREAIFARVRQQAIGEFERRIHNIVELHYHLDATIEYARRMNRDSQIPGTVCDIDPPIGPPPAEVIPGPDPPAPPEASSDEGNGKE
jgi:hypothetical protein